TEKRLLQPRKIVLIRLHVIGVDVGDHRGHGLQVEKGGIGLVGLDDDELAGPEPRVGGGAHEPAADHERGLEPALREHARSEARAAYFVAQIEQHFRDAAHSTSADADKMNSLDLVLHWASSAQTVATADAASGRASDRARLAISRKLRRSSPASTSASRSG